MHSIVCNGDATKYFKPVTSNLKKRALSDETLPDPDSSFNQVIPSSAVANSKANEQVLEQSSSKS